MSGQTKNSQLAELLTGVGSMETKLLLPVIGSYVAHRYEMWIYIPCQRETKTITRTWHSPAAAFSSICCIFLSSTIGNVTWFVESESVTQYFGQMHGWSSFSQKGTPGSGMYDTYNSAGDELATRTNRSRSSDHKAIIVCFDHESCSEYTKWRSSQGY